MLGQVDLVSVGCNMPLAPPKIGGKYHQGYFKPRNPDKYVGNVSNIVYRSGLELRLLQYLDGHPDIVKYCSEEIAIKYLHPVTKKFTNYYPDFLVETKQGTKILIEVKPASQTREPKPTKNKKRMLREGKDWMINSSKWKFAREWCKDHGIEFKILTEKDIDGKATK